MNNLGNFGWIGYFALFLLDYIFIKMVEISFGGLSNRGNSVK